MLFRSIDGRTYELFGGNLWVKVADDPLPKGERHMVSPRDAASIVARRPNRRTTSPVKPCPFGPVEASVERFLRAIEARLERDGLVRGILVARELEAMDGA